MYRKILLGGVTAAAIVGAGGTAIALTGSDSTNGTPIDGVDRAGAGRPCQGQGQGQGASCCAGSPTRRSSPRARTASSRTP